MNIFDYEFPDDRKYLINSTPSHFWFRKSAESKHYTTGLTDFFQRRIGEIYELTLREKGKKLDPGSTLGLVKAKNYSAILKAPMIVEVIEVNNSILKSPKLINSAPYSDGWLYILKTTEDGSLAEKNLVVANDKALQEYLQKEIDNNSLMSSDCCPDFMRGSGIARRKPKNP